MYKLNKKAQEKFLSPWNLLIWAILLVVVIIALALFNASTTDARATEAKTLNNKLLSCLIDYDGSLKHELAKETDLIELCNLSPSLFNEQLVLFAKVEISNEKTQTTTTAGNPDLEVQCELPNSQDNFAKCFDQTILANSDSENLRIKIKTASNHQE